MWSFNNPILRPKVQRLWHGDSRKYYEYTCFKKKNLHPFIEKCYSLQFQSVSYNVQDCICKRFLRTFEHFRELKKFVCEKIRICSRLMWYLINFRCFRRLGQGRSWNKIRLHAGTSRSWQVRVPTASVADRADRSRNLGRSKNDRPSSHLQHLKSISNELAKLSAGRVFSWWFQRFFNEHRRKNLSATDNSVR